MKCPYIIILAFIILIWLMTIKTKEGAYMALLNSGDHVNLDINGYDVEHSGDGNRWYCMQRCLDRNDCAAVVIDNGNNCWLKNGSNTHWHTPDRNTYVKIPDS